VDGILSRSCSRSQSGSLERIFIQRCPLYGW